ncbi:MAG: sigma-54 dependent transcriptional regulator [Gammaproteobacteria bacterium]
MSSVSSVVATPAESSDEADGTGGKQPVSVLVVDNEPGMRNFLYRALARRYALVEVADSVETAEALRQRCHFDLMIVDIRLPGTSGVDWLRALRDQGVRADAIFMTAYADLDTAIAALRAGASDFILKPFRTEQMMEAVRRCLEHRRMRRENFLLRRQVDHLQNLDGIVGHSRAMAEVSAIVQRVAPTASTVLIEGETGTGKELIARAVHVQSGRSGDFVAVNCGSISPELLESELFGHTRGAFTGAHSARDGLFVYAQGGTIFLDEIGEMPLAMQAKLLRVLEEHSVRPVGSDREVPVDCRVIAATNQRLAERVESGEFRGDLYYRLNVLTINVPALRERVEDIPALAEHFSDSMASSLGVSPIPLTHDDFAQLQSYDWPGNVRELKNVIERSLLLGKLPRDCCSVTEGGANEVAEPVAERPTYPSEWTLEQVEREHILGVLEAVGGNKSEAARRLGVSRKTLERKCQAWGVYTTGRH